MDNGKKAVLTYSNGAMTIDNGCPNCEELIKNHVIGEYYDLCFPCQLEQAEATALQAMNEVERIKQKIKEKENAKLP